MRFGFELVFLYSGKDVVMEIFYDYIQRVNRVDIAIIILDTKLVTDFVQHAYCFSIAINRPVLMLPLGTKENITHENCAPQSQFFYDPENEIFFLITSEISKSGRFVHFIYCLSTKVDILLNFRVPYNQ